MKSKSRCLDCNAPTGDAARCKKCDRMWLSVADVAEALSVTETRVHEMIRNRVLDAARHGDSYRIRRSELARYLEHWRISAANPIRGGHR